MTIRQVIDRVHEADDSTQNFSEENIIQWLSNLDGQAYVENIVTHMRNEDEDEITSFSGYTSETDRDTELLIKVYDYDCYVHYILAMIYKYLGEMAKYNSYIAMFNNAYTVYQRWYTRTHKTNQTQHIRNW